MQITLNPDEVRISRISDAKKNDKNPFVDENLLSGKTRKIRKRLADTDLLRGDGTGVINGVAVLHEIKVVDADSFCKIYLGSVSALFDLSRSGIKVLGCVVNRMEPNKSDVYMSIQNIMEACDYSQKNQAYKGLVELVNAKIIAKSNDANVWFVNPSIVFNGDRMILMHEYIQQKENGIASK